jgi:two-component system CheB/CheR fusion protein
MTTTDPNEQGGNEAPDSDLASGDPAIIAPEPGGEAPDFIIGIGASAGGLEALQQFFEHTQRDMNLAYVVVQHLSPDFKSLMRELLSKNTSLRVNNVEDGMWVEPNNVYLIPPRNNMIITDGRLRLIEREPHSGLNLPIDIFFTALAKDRGARAIAVVLSGTGTDGSRGLLDVKDAGGIVLVQQPEDAKFDGMPNAAERTGLADVIKPARELPGTIEQFVEYATNDPAQFNDTDEELTTVFSILRSQSGIDFSKYKISTVSRRIQRRMAVHQVNSLKEYLSILRSDDTESATLCRELLINVTRFFRDKKCFADLEQEVIDPIIERSAASSEIRVWCAGCATGEEAYSVAMLLQEAIERLKLPRSFRVFATDVDQEVISIGAQATYDEYILEDLGQARVQRFFSVSGGKFQIVPEIRRRVVFAPHDITRDPPFSNMDLVVCRNMLIYLKSDVQAQVLSQLYYSVTPKGYLFLGSSEGLGNLSDYFEPVNQHSKIYCKKSGINHPRAMVQNYERTPMRNLVRAPTNVPTNQIAISQAVAEALIDKHLPPSIVFDSDDQAVYVFGEVSDYVRKAQAGAVRNTIGALLHADLNIPVTTAVHRARQESTALTYRGVPFVMDDLRSIVDLMATPLKVNGLLGHVVVVFERHDTASEADPKVEVQYNYDEESNRRLLDLEEELRQARGHLQITVEELETTNEELQSSNEELMASNEELQSTNEELQSVNEELYTVNGEYQEKIREITDLNDDLTNLLHNTNISVLFLDGDLKVRRFTESLKRYFNLMPSDVDRPIGHTTNNLVYTGFLDDLAAANRDSISKVQIVEGPDSEEVCVRIEPYKSSGAERDGVVVSIIANSDAFGLRSSNDQRVAEQPEQPRALLIEDSKQDARLIESYLQQFGEDWDVVWVSTVDEARRAVVRERFSLVLLDLELPDSHGIATVSRINNLLPTTPIVIVTGARDEQTLREAMDAGAMDYIEKSQLDAVTLSRTLTKAMHRKIKRR